MRIAGVKEQSNSQSSQASAFFYFLFFVLQVQRRETVIIASPGSRLGSDYPRHLK